ncbi:MAG: GLUG motif-containing protein [Thermoleophilia bacterium]
MRVMPYLGTSGRARVGLLLAALLATAAFAFPPSAASGNGCITNTPGVADGTAAHPFLIATVANLQCMRDNSGYYWTGQHFRQTVDLDLSGVPVWTATIGTVTTPFTGHYDGNNNTITGLQVSLTNVSNAGLFGVTSRATLANIKLTNAVVSITPEPEFSGVGALVGWARNQTVISHVESSGAISGQVAGGIAGTIDSGSSIASSSSSAVITGNDWCAGGLVGCVGGTVGEAQTSSISDSSATGHVTGDIFVGGLVGGVWAPATITRSYATGDTVGRPPPGYPGGGYVGGLAGLIQAMADPSTAVTIASSFATGNVTATDPTSRDSPESCGSCAGGLVGGSNVLASSLDNVITNSYASGMVTSGVAAGGLVGKSLGGNLAIASSYSRSAVRGPDGSTGGVLGAVATGSPIITSTFWNPTDADNAGTNGFGTQSTQTAMRTPTPYATADWDIADFSPSAKVWVSCPSHNDGYPFLQWTGTAQSWTCASPAAVAIAPGASGTETTSPKGPPAPTGIRWRLAGTKVTSIFTAAPGTTYAISATPVLTMEMQAHSAQVQRRKCTITTNAKTKTRTAMCTIRVSRAGIWLAKVTPKKDGVTGTPATKRFRVRATPTTVPVTG